MSIHEFAFGLQDLKSCYINYFFACACLLCTILCLKTGSISIFGTPQRPPNSNIWKWTIVTNRDKSLGVPRIFRQTHMSFGVSNTLHPPEQGVRPQLSRGHRDCHAAGHSLWIWVWRLIGLRLGLRYFLHSFFLKHTSNYLAWCKHVVPKINDESKNSPNVKNWQIYLFSSNGDHHPK